MRYYKYFKRFFDIIVSLFLLAILIIPVSVCVLLVFFSEPTLNPLFLQVRIGMNGRSFTIFKIRTMSVALSTKTTTVTTANDSRVTKLGFFLRKIKMDEIPQLLNVLFGNMSIVGPRPDVPGFADMLEGSDRIILSVRPGITGLSSVYFYNEEQLLANQSNAEEYNRNKIWPAKIRLNKFYISKYSFLLDLRILWLTLKRICS